jgi:2-polyprenyl-6-methoxyphenol hydroxylase-like FAD-dependent oxidoreductase
MKVLIAGGGIGGLVAAIALAQRNIEVEAFEQQTEPREVGAGIAIFANGARVISSLGIDAELEPLRHYSPGFRIRRGKSGRIIAELPLGGFHERRFGARAYDLHRSDLRQSLLKAAGSKHGVTVHLGQRVAKVIQDQERVTLETDRGLCESGDALIGAAPGWQSRMASCLPERLPRGLGIPRRRSASTRRSGRTGFRDCWRRFGGMPACSAPGIGFDVPPSTLDSG